MTLTDQKQLKHLIDIIPETKQIAIVHNFININSIDNLENYINKDIYGGFHKINARSLTNKYPKKRFFVTENPNIFHCILGNKFSEAGEFYNEETLKFLRERIRNLSVIRSTRIENEITDFLNEQKQFYFANSHKLNFKIIKIDKDCFIIKNSTENSIELNNLNFNPLLLVNGSQNLMISYCMHDSSDNFLLKISIPGITNENIENYDLFLKKIDDEENFKILHFRLKLKKKLSDYFQELENYNFKEILLQFEFASTNVIDFYTREISVDITDCFDMSSFSVKKYNGTFFDIIIPKINFMSKSIVF